MVERMMVMSEDGEDRRYWCYVMVDEAGEVSAEREIDRDVRAMLGFSATQKKREGKMGDTGAMSWLM